MDDSNVGLGGVKGLDKESGAPLDTDTYLLFTSLAVCAILILVLLGYRRQEER